MWHSSNETAQEYILRKPTRSASLSDPLVRRLLALAVILPASELTDGGSPGEEADTRKSNTEERRYALPDPAAPEMVCLAKSRQNASLRSYFNS